MEESFPQPYEGRFADVMAYIEKKRPKEALDLSLVWRDQEPGDALALVALGESYEALGRKDAAARAYGSIIDLFPGRADLRRFAGARLGRLGAAGLDLAVDTFRKAVAQRPDHPASHRFLAYALVRSGRPAEAFDAIEVGLRRGYPGGRFEGVPWILLDDVGLIAAAWIRKEPAKRGDIAKRVRALGAKLPTGPSLRFVLTWETDANDVDFHIYDGRRGHAYYGRKALRSGGELYADVTTGYGPECFAIEGRPRAYPYRLGAHYYSRGPMGYGMGSLQVVEHDGSGGLKFDDRPFVVMTDKAFVKLGTVTGPLK
jgi:tetratricopeptide (TPR) repeat protein